MRQEHINLIWRPNMKRSLAIQSRSAKEANSKMYLKKQGITMWNGFVRVHGRMKW